MKNQFIRAALIGGLVITSACGSKDKKPDELDQKISTQAPADTPNQIMERASMAFANAEGLTQEQKLKLSEIYKRVYTESMQIRRDIGQSKSLLFMTLAKTNYKASEVTELKKKIVNLDQKRLNLMFSALDDVQSVVGKGVAAEKLYRHFEDFEIPRSRE